MYEDIACKFLAKKGYWVHLFATTSVGQPCDIVALKDNIGFLIDVKHTEDDYFEFSRVEPNQETCFELANKKGNKNCFFMIYFEKTQNWRLLSFAKYKFLKNSGDKSVKEDDLWS